MEEDVLDKLFLISTESGGLLIREDRNIEGKMRKHYTTTDKGKDSPCGSKETYKNVLRKSKTNNRRQL